MKRKTVEDRVACGMAFLDTRMPGWHKDVRVGDLDISTSCGCVIGQLFGSYNDNVEGLGLTPHDARDLGFYEFDGQGREERYGRLTAAWQDSILSRFEPIHYDRVA